MSDDRVVKVADFGLSRDIFNSDYYKADRTAPLPVRWMSVESLKDTKFSVKSDVVCILYNYAKGLCTHSLFLAGSVLESADCSTDLSKRESGRDKSFLWVWGLSLWKMYLLFMACI